MIEGQKAKESFAFSACNGFNVVSSNSTHSLTVSEVRIQRNEPLTTSNHCCHVCERERATLAYSLLKIYDNSSFCCSNSSWSFSADMVGVTLCMLLLIGMLRNDHCKWRKSICAWFVCWYVMAFYYSAHNAGQWSLVTCHGFVKTVLWHCVQQMSLTLLLIC